MRSIFLTICIGLFCLGTAVPTCGQKTVTIHFEGLTDLSRNPIIFGVELGGARVLACGGSLNCDQFPPFSGSRVIAGESIGAIFHGALRGNVKKVSARVTGRTNVTMTAFSSEIQGQLLGSAQTGGANFVGSNTGIPHNKLLEISSVNVPINFVTFSGSGSTFTVDDFTIEGSLKSVVIDPGHGQLLKNGVPTFQRDPSPTFQLIEDILTLEISKFVRGHLEADGIFVYQTRTTNLAPFAPANCRNPCKADLKKRARWAEKQEPDLLVSVHTNAGNPKQPGFETANGAESVFSNSASAPKSKALAQFVLLRVVALGLRNRPVKQDNLLIILKTSIVSALIEAGFHTNSQLAPGQTITDEERLNNPFFRALIAEAIFNGIKDYYASIKK